jgi:tetratricopeptide (TPR) repeat protein
MFLPMTPRQIADAHRLGKAAAAALDDGQYAEAEADAREALSLGQDSGMAQEILASALNAQGRTDEALQAYQVMADRGSVYPSDLLPYALLLLKTGHYAKAVVAYNKQLPRLGEGDLMRANSHFSPAVYDPVGLETAIHLALSLTDQTDTWGGHSQDAKVLAEVRQALALTPNSALANLYYGDAVWCVGHHRALMLAAYRKAAALGRGDVKADAEKKLGINVN